MHWREILRRPIVTEKSNQMADQRQYAFVVDGRANKVEIQRAVELAWPNVTVSKVRVMRMPAKRSRRWKTTEVRKGGYKKAIVSLSDGMIELFEGV